jgi:hypothetical protein
MFEPAYQGFFSKSCLEERLNLKFSQQRHVWPSPRSVSLDPSADGALRARDVLDDGHGLS